MKNRWKRWLSAICAAFIIAGAIPVAALPGTVASDVPADAWFINEAAYVLEHGIMRLTDDGKFLPYEGMTRADFCYAVYQMAGTPTLEDPNQPAPFSDIDRESERYQYDAILWAENAGVIAGYSDGRFLPNQVVSRAQIAAFLHRYAKYAGQEYALKSSVEETKFTDELSIHEVFVDDVYWAKENGYVNGFSDGTFRPNIAVTRAQSAAILARFHQNFLSFEGTGQKESSIKIVGKEHLLTSPSYPDTTQFPSFVNSDGHRLSHEEMQRISTIQSEWLQNASKRFNSFTSEEAEPLHGFMTKIIQKYLGHGSGNRVFSPVNAYMALAMLAEVSGGNTQAQILKLLGTEKIEDVRESARKIWYANYRDDVVSSILGNSLWLNEEFNASGVYNNSTLTNLSDRYFASVYEGDPDSDEYVQVFRDWLNAQTGGLLEDAANEQTLGKALTIASTLFFKAKWNAEFSKNETKKGTFHGADTDITCDFMRQSRKESYYWGKKFSAVYQSLASNGGMWFLLPNKGITPEELLNDTEALSLMLSDGFHWEQRKDYVIVNKSIPKFDFTKHFDSKEFLGGLKELGITDAFDKDLADFSNLGIFDCAYVDGGEHAVRTTIDEEGCTAVAFTVVRVFGVMASGIQPEEIDFVLDRPFVFCVTGAGDLPLFTGIVYEPSIAS